MKPILIIADLKTKRQIALKRGMSLANTLGSQVEIVGFCYEYMTGIPENVKKQIRQKLIEKKQAWLEAEVKKQAPEGLKYKVSVVWEKSVHLPAFLYAVHGFA